MALRTIRGMRARRVTATAAAAVLVSLVAVSAARADDTPALTTPAHPWWSPTTRTGSA